LIFNSSKIERYKKHKIYLFIENNKRFAPLLFFVSGFLWDWLTLGRVDRLYDIILLSAYFFLLSFCIYLYNCIGYSIWQHKFLKTYQNYLPLIIQFFFGGLTSAYVIYFSRSVSLSKTASFFVILVLLFFANEIFKKRISNLYLQFGIYSFVSYTFFAYMIPVLIAKLNPFIFTMSGMISLSMTFFLVYIIYKTKHKIKLDTFKIKLLTVIFSVYGLITLFYFFKLIPPVPLALNQSIVAYAIEKKDNRYQVTYDAGKWYMFWKEYKSELNINKTDEIYVFTSIFAPTDLDKKIFHLWKKYNSKTKTWDVTDKIGFSIIGGRNNGFRGYTFKQNITEGEWEVEVITEEGLIIGIIDFNLVDKEPKSRQLRTIHL